MFDGGGELSHVELAAFLDVVALVGGLPLLDKGEQGPELVDVNLQATSFGGHIGFVLSRIIAHRARQ